MKTLTRRHILRGAGVALALPWLESLAPRPARGQAVAPRLRFVPIFFPLGTRSSYWIPKTTGAGNAWQLSPLLEPLAPVKDQVTVLTGVNQTAFGPVESVEPGNGYLTGTFLTCAKGAKSSLNGISIDQRIAKALGGATKRPSLQLGLSTLDSYCDGAPCSYSRSISWLDPETPLYKLVNPQGVFDTIVGDTPTSGGTKERLAARKSVLDYVVGSTSRLEPRLGRSDRARVDQFLTSVRDLELRVAADAASTARCTTVPRPTLSASTTSVPLDYNRGAHADVMIDLIVMALSCDVTRIISFMLDDARSYFSYDFLPIRHFTDMGSTPGGVGGEPMTAGGLLGAANAGDENDDWATIVWWFVSKASALCQKLAAIPDGENATLLDNSLVWFGSGQRGEDLPTNLPVLYVGGAGGALKVNRSLNFVPGQSLSNVYLTFLNKVFGVPDAAFGDSTGLVPDLLA
jgi:Protein of unknown function (DUF1552)